MAKTRAERLIQEHIDARDRIIKRLLEYEAHGLPTAYLKRQLKYIEDEVVRLMKLVRKELRQIALEEYNRAIVRAALMLGISLPRTEPGKPIALPAPPERLQLSESPAIEQIIYDKQERAVEALYSVGRRAQDVVREINAEVITGLIDNKYSVKDAKQMLLDRLIGQDKEGMGGIRYKNGAVMPFEKYAAMVARTTTREAQNTASIDMALRFGGGLTKMSTHYPTCAICAPRQGRVYRLIEFPEGDVRNGFPYIGEAFPNWPQYATVHPHCRHNLRPIAWDGLPDGEKAKLLKESTRPFDKDPRKEAEVAAYNATQDLLRCRNEDWKQYKRYKAALGDNAPKSFSGFRRMKASNSERWQEIRADYRYILKVSKRESRIISTELRSLPMRAEPGDVKDLVKPSGEVVQRRIYGEDGRPRMDIDTNDHGNSKYHPWGPHAHDWDYNEDDPRQLQRELSTDELRQNKDILGGD